MRFLFVPRWIASRRCPYEGWVMQRFIDGYLQCPIFLGQFSFVVERGDRDAERLRDGIPALRVAHQFFFLDSDNLSVSSPTSSRNILFSRFSFTYSLYEGAPSTPFPSQPYMVVSEMLASLAATETDMPSSLIRFTICSRTSGAMRYFFLHDPMVIGFRPFFQFMGYRLLEHRGKYASLFTDRKQSIQKQ